MVQVYQKVWLVTVNNISVVDLGLTEHKGRIVTSGKAVLRPIYDAENKKALAENDPEITALLNQFTKQHVNLFLNLLVKQQIICTAILH